MPHTHSMTLRRPIRHQHARPVAVLALALALALGAMPCARAGHDGGGGGSFCPRPVLSVTVPFAAGGPADSVARELAKALGEQVRHTVIVENQGGGGGLIGAARVAGAPPSGCTFLVTTHSSLLLGALAIKNPPAGLDKLLPVARVAERPHVLMVLAGAPWRDVAALRASRDRVLNFGSVGLGSFGHYAGRALGDTLQQRAVGVPYKNIAPMVNGLLGGQIDYAWVPLDMALPQAKAGKLRALAVAASARVPALSDVPTAMQAGIPQVDLIDAITVFTPAGLSQRDRAAQAADVLAAARSAAFGQALDRLALRPAALGGDALVEALKVERGGWARAVNTYKLQVD